MKHLARIADLFVLFLAAHLVLWLFTGIHLWAQTQEGDFRSLMLLILHLAATVYGFCRVGALLETSR
jgi:hypothetical protein